MCRGWRPRWSDAVDPGASVVGDGGAEAALMVVGDGGGWAAGWVARWADGDEYREVGWEAGDGIRVVFFLFF